MPPYGKWFDASPLETQLSDEDTREDASLLQGLLSQLSTPASRLFPDPILTRAASFYSRYGTPSGTPSGAAARCGWTVGCGWRFQPPFFDPVRFTAHAEPPRAAQEILQHMVECRLINFPLQRIALVMTDHEASVTAQPNGVSAAVVLNPADTLSRNFGDGEEGRLSSSGKRGSGAIICLNNKNATDLLLIATPSQTDSYNGRWNGCLCLKKEKKRKEKRALRKISTKEKKKKKKKKGVGEGERRSEKGIIMSSCDHLVIGSIVGMLARGPTTSEIDVLVWEEEGRDEGTGVEGERESGRYGVGSPAFFSYFIHLL
eukprot:gene11794-8105_t